MTTPLPDAAALRQFLIRKLMTAPVDGPGSDLVTQFPHAAADCVMAVVRPVLEGLSAEVELLRSASSSEEGRG